MRFIKKFIVTVLVAILVVLIALYFLLQTRWGAGFTSNLITENSRWQLTFDKLEHRWAVPSHLVFQNLSVGYKDQPAMLSAKRVDVGLSSRQLTTPRYVDSLLLEDGTLNLNATPPLLRADTLRLKNMAINQPALNARQVSGGVSPWLPEAGYVLGRTAQIQFSAGELTLNGVTARNALLQGSINNGEIDLSTIGADLARGTLTARARRDSQGHWWIQNLRLNEVRLQSDKPLADFLAPVATLPALTLARLDIVDARLEGPGWAFNDLDLSLRNLALDKGEWRSDDGTLSLNASEIIWGNVQLNDPILDADLKAQSIALRKLSTRWERGMVRASGEWQRGTRTLALSDLALVGLEYTLAQDWKALWLAPTPGWISNLTVQNMTASRNLLIDIDPAFPFQLTSLDASGQQLQLARDGQWGLWSGTLNLTAAAATFNRTDVRRPSLKLDASPENIRINDMSLFAGEGMLEAKGEISQQPQRPFTLDITGRNVPLDTLNNWGWPPLTLQGNGAMQLNLTGNLAAHQPLKPTVSGQLHATDSQGHALNQTMVDGSVNGAAAIDPQANAAGAQAVTQQPVQQGNAADNSAATQQPVQEGNAADNSAATQQQPVQQDNAADSSAAAQQPPVQEGNAADSSAAAQQQPIQEDNAADNSAATQPPPVEEGDAAPVQQVPEDQDNSEPPSPEQPSDAAELI